MSDDFRIWHSYNAACIAVRAATGQDEDITAFGVEEWGHLTGLALKWLRESLARRTAHATDARQRQELRAKLTHWKDDPDLAAVRDAAFLAAMAPTDRAAWQALWRDVDAVLSSIAR